MQVDDFASSIQAIRKCIAKLYQNLHQLPLPAQKWLEESCQELSATVQELAVTQKVLLQQTKDLEIQLKECLKIRDCKQTEAALRDSEERFRCLSACSPVGIFLTDVEGRCTYTNPRCQAICGYTSEDRLREGWSQLVHPDDRARVFADWSKTTREGREYSDEFRLQTRQTKVCWVHVRSSPMFSDRGTPIGHVGTVEDITERKQTEDALKQAKEQLEIRVEERITQLRAVNHQLLSEIAERQRAEEALRASEEQYRRIIETTSEGVWIIDAENKTVFASNRMAEMLGYTLDEILGVPVLQFMNEEWQAIAALSILHLRKGKRETFDFQLRRKDGSNLWAMVSANPILDQVGHYAGALGMFTDITERKQAEVELQQSEQKYRNLFHNSLVGMLRTSLDNGTIFDANLAALKMFGYDTYQGIRTVDLYINPANRNTFKQQVLEKGFIENFEAQVKRKDGSIFWVSSCAKLYPKEGYLEGIMLDITERKQSEEALRAKEEFLQLILDNIPQYIFWKDRNLVYLGCNRNFARAAGLNCPEEIVGKTDYDLPWKTEESDFFRECDARVMETDTPEFHIIEPQLQADGKQAWLDTSKIPLHDAEGNVVGILGSYEDITERQIAQEKIRYQAMHDLLTGLPNRALFNERLSMSLTKAQNSHNLLAVMFLDLDRFKTINDTLGHAVGDRLLQEVAQRLSNCLRQEDTVARWGGDEFTLLVSETSSAEEVVKIAQCILDTLKPTFNLEEQTNTSRSTSLHISTSIGIALYPHDGEDAETLLRNADAALYRAKQQGRNNYQLYTAAMNSQACELLTLENELHHALKREEFEVYYQPQVNITTGEITGMEALVRWQHPKCGLISPAKFIPLAEETGLIVALDEWVLKTACTQNKAWQNAGLPPVRVAVNLSARQFQQPSLLDVVAQILQNTGLSPQFLELEITETIAMYDVDKTRTILSHLQQMGVYLSIDDFGTGYCSLGYLKQFPLHTLKIDKSFVRDIATDPLNAGIVNAIMTLGKGFNLRVLAEGVETEAQRECLRSFQCEEIQGYLSSPPLSTEDATQFLRNAYSLNSKVC